MAECCKFIVATLIGLIVMSGSGPLAHAEPLTIGASPSLRAAFNEIGPLFEREYGATVHIAYTPSKTLLRDIEHGAPIDVFLAADTDKIEMLHKKGLTRNSPRIFTQTSLVLVMPADSSAGLRSLDEAMADHGTRIALGDPDTSYLGEITARELVKRFPGYKTRSRILYASNSDGILALLRTGKADVGLVYRANLINANFVRISEESPILKRAPVQFGQAVTVHCRPTVRTVAEQFSDFLMTPRIQNLLMKYGFERPTMQYDTATGQKHAAS